MTKLYWEFKFSDYEAIHTRSLLGLLLFKCWNILSYSEFHKYPNMLHFSVWPTLRLEARIQTSVHKPTATWRLELRLCVIAGQISYYWASCSALFLFSFVIYFSTICSNENFPWMAVSPLDALQFGFSSNHTKLFNFGIFECFPWLDFQLLKDRT